MSKLVVVLVGCIGVYWKFRRHITEWRHCEAIAANIIRENEGSNN